MHQALHGQSEDRLLRTDGVAPGNDTTRGGHDFGRGRQDLGHCLDRHGLGEGGNVQRQQHPATHGEDITARVGGGDGAEVARLVDEGWEEVGGRYDGGVVVEPVHGGIVEWRQPHEEPGCGLAGERLHKSVEGRCPPLGRTPTA